MFSCPGPLVSPSAPAAWAPSVGKKRSSACGHKIRRVLRPNFDASKSKNPRATSDMAFGTQQRFIWVVGPSNNALGISDAADRHPIKTTMRDFKCLSTELMAPKNLSCNDCRGKKLEHKDRTYFPIMDFFEGQRRHVYGHVLRGPPTPHPQMVWEAAPLPPPVVSALVGLIVWGLPLPPLWCGVWWGRFRAGKSWWGLIVVLPESDFPETLGCSFRCFGDLGDSC